MNKNLFLSCQRNFSFSFNSTYCPKAINLTKTEINLNKTIQMHKKKNLKEKHQIKKYELTIVSQLYYNNTEVFKKQYFFQIFRGVA